MPGLPAIDFRSIRPHAGAQDRGFEELCFQLLPALGPLPAGAAGRQRHGASDGGVEFIVTLPDGGVWAWQAKYLFALGPKEFKQLDASVKRALDSQSTLRRYTFCLPYNRPAGNEADAESALKKWKDHCEKWQKWARERGREPVEFAYVGESELLALLGRADHAGRAYYWFNATVLTPQWFQARLEEAIAHAGQRYTPVLNVELPITFVFEGLGRTRAFRDRLRGLLRDLRDASGRWHELRKSAVDDARLKDLVDEAVRQLDAMDARAIAMDTSGTAPLDFPGLATACSTADQALEKIQECLDTRRREANRNRESSDEGGARPALRSHDPDESGYFAAVTPVWRTGSALRAFAEFVEDDAARLINLPALLLTGEPGIGKTHLMCDVAERRRRAGQPTLVLFGQHFGPGDPWPQLLQHLQLDCTPDVFLGALNTAAEAADARALLFIDALNESAAPRPWPDHLAGVVAKVSGYPRLGIALACRTSFVPVAIPDPSLLLAATPAAAQETAALPWWAPVAAEVPDAADKDAREGWLSTLDGLPHAPSLVDVRDPKARHWLVLVGNYDWTEPVPPELDPHLVDRCTVWYRLESYVVRRADALRFLSWARDRHWFDGWVPERHRLGDACLGEYPWHPAAADARGGWDTPGDGGTHSPVPLLATAATYTAGHGADASSDRPVRGLVPSSALLEGMSAAWRGVDFEYVDTRGAVVAWDPSAGQRGPSCLLVDSKSFKAYLDWHEYAVVWTVLGRKLIIGPSLHRIGIHGRSEFSGVLALTQGAVEQVSFHHEYVPPGGSR